MAVIIVFSLTLAGASPLYAEASPAAKEEQQRLEQKAKARPRTRVLPLVPPVMPFPPEPRTRLFQQDVEDQPAQPPADADAEKAHQKN